MLIERLTRAIGRKTAEGETHAAVIWFHPEGEGPSSFSKTCSGLVSRLAELGVESVFLPSPSVLAPSGKHLPDFAWYGYTVEEAGLKDKVDIVEMLMFVDEMVRDTRERLGLSYDRIFLAGLGQGGYMALEASYCLAERFAGVISLEPDLPLGFSPAARLDWDLPVLVASVCEGDLDLRTRQAQAVAKLDLMGYRVVDRTGRHRCAGGFEDLLESVRIFVETHLQEGVFNEWERGVPYNKLRWITE